MKRYLVAFLLTAVCPFLLMAQGERTDYGTGQVYFRLGQVVIDDNYKGNGETLRKFVDELEACRKENNTRVGKIRIVASVSPDGSVEANERVAKRRAESIVSWIRGKVSFPLEYVVESEGIDWNLLTKLVEETPAVPYREKVLDVLQNVPEYIYIGEKVIRNRYNKLLEIHGGESLSWMYRNLFPSLRYVTAYTDVWREPEPAPQPPVVEVEPAPAAPQEEAVETVPVVEETPSAPKPFYWAVKTNLLYDVAFIPNIGAEIYLGKNWSLAANWQYIWLRNKAKHKYWRVGAGDVAIRKWFGSKASQKPLTGHHLGAYAQMMTYDFAPTGKEGTIAEDWNWSLGLEYGYSHPIARRLNLDFTLGVGYHWGEYKKYSPIDDHSVWLATKKRSYFGPTKAEVSLVWLLGRGNYNKEKGGNR